VRSLRGGGDTARALRQHHGRTRQCQFHNDVIDLGGNIDLKQHHRLGTREGGRLQQQREKGEGEVGISAAACDKGEKEIGRDTSMRLREERRTYRSIFRGERTIWLS
jgi:hypothetical protein